MLLFWSAPHIITLHGHVIVSAGVLGRHVIRGRVPYSTKAPAGAVWGGLYLDVGEVPLLVGAFAPPPGEMRLTAVRREGGPALEGEGVLDPLGPHEFDEAVGRLRGLGHLFSNDPTAPPLPLWAARRGI
ncbi:MAG: hypothetical protein ACP5QE_08270 [Conexivisphaera sp.]